MGKYLKMARAFEERKQSKEAGIPASRSVVASPKLTQGPHSLRLPPDLPHWQALLIKSSVLGVLVSMGSQG
jgi:hypothetical protein